MGLEYTPVLQALNVPFVVVGNRKASCDAFFEKTGVEALPGGAETILTLKENGYNVAINAVSIESLTEINKSLIDIGISKILIEKPAALHEEEFEYLKTINSKEIFVAYNRRFYSSVQMAEKIIEEDGGVTSFHFEFTEWIDRFLDVIKNKDVLASWFMCNSTHIVDLAFYLGGKPTQLNSLIDTPIDWHPSGTNFVGSGKTDKGCLFTYKANWLSAGRWGIEVHTQKRKLVFSPIEGLKQVMLNSVKVEEVDLGENFDTEFKPGLYKMVNSFLKGEFTRFQTLDQFIVDRETIFKKMISSGGNK